MSVQQQNNVPMKGQIIINPTTQRPVEVGSRTWLNLVKKGLVDGTYSDPNELYEVAEGDNVDEKIQELNKNLPINEQSVRGRGKYVNKIVKRNRNPSLKQTAEYTAKVASKVVADPEVYEQLHEADDFELQLENMIMAEMMGSSKPKARGRASPAPKEQQYYEQATREYDEYDEGDEDDCSDSN